MVEDQSADYAALIRLFARALATEADEKHLTYRAMIQNDEQLQQATEALNDLYRALASYRSKILPVNPRNYTVIAQGPLDEIRKIRGEIDQYLGLPEETLAADALKETPPDFGTP